MDQNDRGYSQLAPVELSSAAVDPKLRAFMIGVYNKVALGLLVSAGLAYLTSGVPAVRDLMFTTAGDTHRFVGFTLLGLITVLSPLGIFVAFGSTEALSARRARTLYWSIVATVGASLGVSFLIYTTASLATIFAASAAGFGALSLWAYTTRRDLKSGASFWITGLVGLMVMIALNLVLRSPAMNFALSALGVIVFAGLIAWDTQHLKCFYDEIRDDEEALSVATDIGALRLYLGFINLFQMALTLIGGRR